MVVDVEAVGFLFIVWGEVFSIAIGVVSPAILVCVSENAGGDGLRLALAASFNQYGKLLLSLRIFRTHRQMWNHLLATSGRSAICLVLQI